MAFTSQLNHFLPCKTLSPSPPQPRLINSNPSLFPPNFTPKLKLSNPEEASDVAGVAVMEKPDETEEISKLKKALVDSFYGTDGGLSATSETRAEIVELITQLEAQNLTPAPTEALPLLNGKWILAYTSFAGLFPILSRGTLPLVKVVEISQLYVKSAAEL